jgi:hypothetical protein
MSGGRESRRRCSRRVPIGPNGEVEVLTPGAVEKRVGGESGAG